MGDLSDWVELLFMTRLGDTFEFLEVAATSGRLQLKDGSIDPEEARRVVDNPALGCLLNQRLFTSTSVFVPGKEVDADTKALLDGQKRGGDGSFERRVTTFCFEAFRAARLVVSRRKRIRRRRPNDRRESDHPHRPNRRPGRRVR